MFYRKAVRKRKMDLPLHMHEISGCGGGCVSRKTVVAGVPPAKDVHVSILLHT